MFYEWKPYVSVGARRTQAKRLLETRKKKGEALAPVLVNGRIIASSYWGRSWCENLESYSDYENRLPRGRSYVRNGSVIDLRIEKGSVAAQVSGSSLYETRIQVKPLAPARWKRMVDQHAAQVASVVELLQGKLPESLLESLADRASGLFPAPKELEFSCTCPDWAEMCKHVAAALYGVGSRLDAQPELFFLLRGVEVTELAARGAEADFGAKVPGDLAGSDLGALFGIELDGGADEPAAARTTSKKRAARGEVPLPRRPTRENASAVKQPSGRAVATKAERSPRSRTATAKQLAALGVPPATIAYWARTGTLIRSARGVFLLTPTATARLKRYRK